MRKKMLKPELMVGIVFFFNVVLKFKLCVLFLICFMCFYVG
jgi:hypothetical protein